MSHNSLPALDDGLQLGFESMENLVFYFNSWKSIGKPSDKFPYDQGTKIGVPRVFRRIPKYSSTNICGVPQNSDSYPSNTLVIRDSL